MVWGIREMGANIKKLRRSTVHIRIGRPFLVESEGRLRSEDRQQMADEMMCRLAGLLPEEFRGHYSDFADRPTVFLKDC